MSAKQRNTFYNRQGNLQDPFGAAFGAVFGATYEQP
jgi:hypothetical protein